MIPVSVSVASFVTTPSSKVCVHSSDFTSCPHVASCQWKVSSLVQNLAKVCVCGSFAILSVFSYLQTVQVEVFSPSSVSVASFVTTASPNVCTAFSLTYVVCSHVAACQWLVSSLVHFVE